VLYVSGSLDIRPVVLAAAAPEPKDGPASVTTARGRRAAGLAFVR
jgi:hypothetical protein